jgi:hypothetical protein
MNARMEIAMNSKNLGAKITENGAPNWALEVIKDKTVISGGSAGISRILEWLEGLGAKDRGLLQNLVIIQGFKWNLARFRRV